MAGSRSPQGPFFPCDILCIHICTSKITLQPVAQNFLVDMRDEWARSGTIRTSVISLGSHGIYKLHLCVDLIVRPLGSVMVIGLVVCFRFTTNAPST